MSRFYRHFVTLILALMPLAAPALFADTDLSEPAVYPSDGISFIPEARGNWSPGVGNVLIDLAGDWKVDEPEQGWPDSLTVPFAWDGWEGDVVISRHFSIPDSLADYHWRLHIDGFAQHIAIRVNNDNLDTRRGDGLAVQLQLDKRYLQTGDGRNLLTIALNRRLNRRNTIPLRGGIYAVRRYGGIYYGIYLIGSPPTCLTDLSAYYYQESGVERIAASADFHISDSPELSPFTTYRLLRRDGSIVAVVGPLKIANDGAGVGRQTVEFRLNDVPKGSLNPIGDQLRVEAVLSAGGSAHQLTAAVSATDLSHTDNPFTAASGRKLLGVDYYNAHPIYGPMSRAELIREDVHRIAAMGAHFVRVQQGTASPQFLTACEDFGLMVLEELPVWQAPDALLADGDFRRSALEQLSTIVHYHKRFTCIAGWGLGGGLSGANERNTAYFRVLSEQVRALDRRPVFAGFQLTEAARTAHLDFAVLELTPWRSYDAAPLPHSLVGEVPLVLGGIRGAVIPGRLGGWNERFSEAWQANRLVHWTIEASKLGWVNGVTIGDWADWRGVLPSFTGPFRGVRDLYSTGLVAVDRRPRLAYSRIKELWSSGQVEPLSRGNEADGGGDFLLIAGFILTAVLVVSLRQNKIFRLNLQRSLFSTRIFFQDIRDNRYFQVGHTVLTAVLITGGTALIWNAWLQVQRDNPALDWLAGYLLGSRMLMEWFSWLVWNPERGLLFFWSLAFVAMWLMVLQSSFVTRFTRKRTTLIQHLNFVVWSSAPGLVLIPIGAASQRLYEAGLGWIPGGAFFAAFILSALRIIAYYPLMSRHGLMTAALVWLGIPLAATAALLILLHQTHYLGAYWHYFLMNVL